MVIKHTKICPKCGKEFEAKKRNQIYCSNKCGISVRVARCWQRKVNKIKVLDKNLKEKEYYKVTHTETLKYKGQSNDGKILVFQGDLSDTYKIIPIENILSIEEAK